MVDYTDLYDGYWRRSDRIGETSFADPEQLAQQILSTCGPGRFLDIGCGMGVLVRELLKQGADAYGIDVSTVAAAECNRITPGRFFAGSILALPFPDESFDSLISTDCLEHLAPTDIPHAIRELRRVCRRNLYLCVATEPDRDGHWHLTVEKREWWERAAFSFGFRKHPCYYAIMPFHALEAEGNSITIPLQKIPDDALSSYPLDALLEQRDLHMDMSRETGRRSDAHMARYQLVADFVRDGDTILDAACGMGYGSHLLSAQAAATCVIGADLDVEAIRYASLNFAGKERRLSFRVADVQQLDFLPDNSIDLFVSFETLEHVPRPELVIAEARRVLRPGGRFIASVPNLWVNEEGVDPNPHHLHVYDWERVTKEVQTHFLVEAAYGQIAGGGMKLHDHPRVIREISPECERPPAAEWFLLVAMKDPVEGRDVTYEETVFRWEGDPPNVTAFARDYENPWLIKGIISIGWRNRNADQRANLARRVLANSSPHSPDTGAALCILSYDLLRTSNGLAPKAVNAHIARIDAYVELDRREPQFVRWVISLLYVRGLLFEAIGELDKAIGSFSDCADVDPLAYSPLLATKTVDACRIAGTISFNLDDKEHAKEFWTRGLVLAEKAVRGDWREVYGDAAHPFTFGLRELSQVLDTAGRCADGIHHLDAYDSGRGLVGDGSIVLRLENNDRLLEVTQRKLGELQTSPPVRLQKALYNDPRSLRRLIRIAYLLAIILTPAKLKNSLRPIAEFFRRSFVK